MPHLTVEYSANLEPDIDAARLVATVHEAALATGIFPEGGVRTRAARRDVYAIADGHPDNAFVHLAIRIGAGRSPDARKQAGQTIFAALTAALEEVFAARPLGISMELTESNPEMSWKRNNLHDTIAHRKGGPAA